MLKYYIALSFFLLSSLINFCFSAESCDTRKLLPTPMRKMTIPLQQIHRYADGFNVEGNDLSKYLQPGQKWMNMCMILDRPFIEKRTLAEITAENKFPLKEMSILAYNECKVNLAVMLVIDHFKKKGAQEKLFIQVHRNTSGLTYIRELSSLLIAYYGDEMKQSIHQIEWPADPERTGFPVFHFSNGFVLELRNGYMPNTLMEHPDFTTLFSLSLMGGLSHVFPSGTITLPTTFIPFDIQSKKIHFYESNTTENYLIKAIDTILDVNQETFFKVINQFKSKNDQKGHEAIRLTNDAEDFCPSVIFKIKGLWDPTPDSFDDLIQLLGYGQSKT